MNPYDSLKIKGFDHIEFAVDNLEKTILLHKKLGFLQIGIREARERGLTSVMMAQGNARILLSKSTVSTDPVYQFVSNHGEGIFNVALQCENSHAAFEQTVQRGALPFGSPRTIQKEMGKIETAAIRAFGDVIHTFVSREGSLLAEGFNEPVQIPKSALGIIEIDHITSNVEKGKLETWAKWYENIFGLMNTRFFDIRTEKTGLLSKVMESPDHRVKIPLNEPTNPKSQIQEFLNVNHGPGIQHLALLTNDILLTVPHLQTSDIQFLEGPPSAYYEAITQRVPHVSEDLKTIQDLSILVDGDPSGYLLQIFTQNVVGPFFYEVIQRKGNQGFGEGNFTALFEAIERDQIRRGVL